MKSPSLSYSDTCKEVETRGKNPIDLSGIHTSYDFCFALSSIAFVSPEAMLLTISSEIGRYNECEYCQIFFYLVSFILKGKIPTSFRE